MGRHGSTEAPLLLGIHEKANNITTLVFYFLAFITITILLAPRSIHENAKAPSHDSEIVVSSKGVVAADDARCSEVGASILRKGGHAVDAAVGTTLCVGVVNPMASGIGGGAFMVVRSSLTSQALAYDMRETAPHASSQDMYTNNPEAKLSGPLSMGVPGELAGLHEAWKNYGRLPWKTLFEPAIKLAKNGYKVLPYLSHNIMKFENIIIADQGLRRVFAPNGKILKTGDTCYNLKLAQSLEVIAKEGPRAFYNGTVGEKLVEDVRNGGGILTMEDLENYKVKVGEAMEVDVMGYKVLGMPPPSSGTLGLALILNILNEYGSIEAVEGSLGLHRIIEGVKHMLAIRMNLGDPAFVDIHNYISDMTSTSFAKKIWQKINDTTTFPPEYYVNRWSQLQDNGTSHFCIVDADRNAVSMTTTVNYPFGAGMLSPSTGIILNNEMGDFSTPTEIDPRTLPPAPANFIRPGKRPLSSMTPLIVLKGDQVVGVIGGSGGADIISAVAQVFINHFILGMNPLSAVRNPRIYHKLVPNEVHYENLTAIDGEHIELPIDRKVFLEERGHQLTPVGVTAICQLIVQTFEDSVALGRKIGRNYVDDAQFGTLIAVSDPRKDGKPAAF